MSRSFRLVFLTVVMIGSLLAGPVTPVRAAALPAEINKQFTPLQIDAGGVSVLRVTIFNPNTFQLTNAGWTDNLVGVQPGLFIANPANVVNTCGLVTDVTAVPGTSTLTLSNGTVPAQVGSTPGECYVEVNVSSVTAGNLINTIPANNLSASGNDNGTPVTITNTTPASATITIIAVTPPSLSKGFVPNTIFVGDISELTIRVNNNDIDTNLTNLSYTDTLPGGLVLANPVNAVVTDCGPFSLTANPGSNTVALSGATVTPSQDCLVTVNVTGPSGQYTNTIPAGPGGPGSIQTQQGVTNGSPASANLNIQPVGIIKAFSPTTVDAGDSSTLTITLQNPTGSPYTNVTVTDNLPAGLTVSGTPTTTCGAGTVSTNPGLTSVTLTNGTIPASASPPTPNTCTITVPVQAALTASGTLTNTIPANAVSNGTPGFTNFLPATATITVNPALTGTKAYSPTSIVIGGVSTVTITLTNNSSTDLTGVTFTDTMPANLNISGTPATPQCGGAISNTTTSVTLTGGIIAANSSCTITFNVTSTVPGSGTTYENTIPAGSITTTQGVGNGSTIQTGTDLTVVNAATLPVTIAKSFLPTTVAPGQASRVRITITAPADTGISGISITDTLPAGVVVATPNPPTVPAPAESCPGPTSGLIAVPGTNTITFTNTSANTLPAGASCTIDVFVVANDPNVYNNVVPANSISTTQGRTNNVDSNTATLTVTSMTMSKAFYPTTVQANGLSTMTITLQNTTGSPLINVQLTDNLPGTVTNGIVVANPANASTTCGPGVVTANPGTQTVTLTGGVIPAQVGGVPGICTIIVDVQGRDSSPATPTSFQNIIPIANVSGTVQSSGVTIRPAQQAQATLSIQPLSIGVVKGFDPVLVYGGATSTMTVQLINPNNATLTGIQFTDNMDLLYLPGESGIKLANPPDFDTGTCGGTLTGNPGDASFSFSGGTLPPNSSCTLTLKVIMIVNGNRTNRIPAGAVTTFNGVTSTEPTEASLTNLPGVRVTKEFNPDTIQINDTATLTITITNTSNINVVDMQVNDNLPGTLPAGLFIANPANANTTCVNGILTADPGTQLITLTNGELPGKPDDTSPDPFCTITVSVTSTVPGIYVNTIPVGGVTGRNPLNDEVIENNNEATDTLTVNGSNYSLGNRVWFDTDNSGTINGTEIGINGVDVELYSVDAFGNPTFVASQTTANGGYYRFDNLLAGDYVVVIPSSEFGAGGTLLGYWSSGTTRDPTGAVSETAAPDPDNDVDSDDNGTLQTGGTFNGGVASLPVTLGPGTSSEPTNDTDADPTNPAGEAPNGQSNRTVDFGFYRLELGDLVYVDVNANGTFDAGDVPLPGATVQLFSGNGTEIITGADGIPGTADDGFGPDGISGNADDGTGGVITGAGGTYLFSGLQQGDYIVRVTPPAGYSSTIDTFNNADTTNPNTNINNNDNGVGTGGGQVTSNTVTLTPGSAGAALNNTVTDATGTTTNPTVDFGFVSPGFSLGNRVWFDTDNSSAINGAEVGVDGVTIELYAADAGGNPTGAVLATQTTANGGYYRFDNLNPGNYVVVVPASNFDAGGALDGYWSSGTTLLSNNSISETVAPDPDNDVDSDDNGTRQVGGPFNGAVISSAVTLGPAANEPTTDTDADPTNPPGEAPDAQSNRTVDFGFYRVEIGNLVFIDINGDGDYDAGTDLPMQGAVVRLFTSTGIEILVGPDGILGTADDAATGVTTGASGTYLFSGLPQGDYIVRVTPPAGNYTSTVDTSNPADTTDPDGSVDNNDNGIGTAAGQVSSGTLTMNAGETGASINVSDASGTTTDTGVDFGFVTPLFSLGNRVWFDTDNSSAINGAEVGVDGVTVQLYAADAGGNPTGAVLATQTTANGGYYRFDDLLAGDYVVVIPSSQFASGGPLEGYWSSGTTIDATGTVNESAAPDPDNNTDSDDNGTLQSGGTFDGAVISGAVTLGPNADEPTTDADADPTNPPGEAPDAQSNRTVDFGFYRASLGNLVYLDTNGDGTFNAGDVPLQGATVQLFASDGTTEINVGPDGIFGTADDAPGGVTTSASGTYLFSGLPQGDYIVRVTPPAGYASTVDTADSADTGNPNTNTDNNDNGIGQNGGQVSSNIVTLTPGSAGAASNNTVNNATGTTNDPTLDFGFVTSSGLSKSITDTSEIFTSGNDVAIGEIITYEVGINLPVGVALTNVTVTDRMDLGLAYVDCLSVIVAGTDVTATVCPSAVVSPITDPGDSPTNPANPGRQVEFTLGDIPAQASASTVEIQYRAIVLDVIENQDGVDLNNNVTWAFDGGSFSTSAPNVNIVEPDLTIEKTATPTSNVAIGTPVQFTLTIGHTNQSTADAFDVVVSDFLPATLEYIPCSLTVTGLPPTTSTATCPAPATDLIFTWDDYPLGSTTTITFNARLLGSPATNLASVAWTSLPIDPVNGLPVQLSPHNSTSTERWYDPLDDVNVYSVSDSVTINEPGGGGTDDDEEEAENLPKELPDSGFAPNVATRLPIQPVEKAYASTDVWLEIPSLAVRIPVVGVPVTDDNWDVTWLWRQAGWLDGTAFPGWKGNSVLTGHVVLPNGNAGPFAALGDLKWGDRIIIRAYGTVYIYEVRQNRIVSPYNISVLQHEEDAWLTLLTCKDYNESADTYARRIAVRAVLVKVQTDTSSGESSNIR